MVRLLYISIWTRCWCFRLSRQLLVSTPPGFFPSLPAMLPCMTLTRLSFHNLESPTSSTTERENILHGVILSVCWCAQLPLQLSCFYFHEKNIGIIHLKLILCHVSCHPDVFLLPMRLEQGTLINQWFFLIFKCVYIYKYMCIAFTLCFRFSTIMEIQPATQQKGFVVTSKTLQEQTGGKPRWFRAPGQALWKRNDSAGAAGHFCMPW